MKTHRDTVIILAAGSGTRMGEHKFVPKCLLPYKGTAILHHIISKYPSNSRFVIAVNKDDRDIQDFVAVMGYSNVEFVKCENPVPGNPLFDLLECVKNQNTPFFFTVADGVYDLPSFTFTKNWLGIYYATATKAHLSNYTNVKVEEYNQVTRAYEKQLVPGTYPWTGVAYISAARVFVELLDSLLHYNPQASFGDLFNKFNKFIVRQPFPLYGLFHPSWEDLGHEHLYKESLPALDWSKPDQITYFDPTQSSSDVVVKCFKDEAQACQFVSRYKEFSSYDAPLFPKALTRHGRFVSYKWIPGSSGYTSLTAPSFIKLLHRLWNKTWLAHTSSPSDTKSFCEFAVNKTRARLDSYFDRHHPVTFSHVNGVQLSRDWTFLLKQQVWSKWKTLTACLHGDLTLSNMIVDDSGESTTLIDWRLTPAYHSTRGDLYYELGKLYLSLSIDLDQVREGNFTYLTSRSGLEIGLPTNSRLNYLKSVFREWAIVMGLNLHTIERQAILHLASMSGCHKNPFADLFYWYSLFWAHTTDSKPGRRRTQSPQKVLQN
jgi:choline kinase